MTADGGTIEVTTVLRGEDVPVGRIFRTRASASFTYREDYLRRHDAFALAPGLALLPGPQPMLPDNPFSDSAPDTWGRRVLDRAAGRRLDEISLLLGVDDAGRQGATRFWVGGIAVADQDGIPVECELAEIIRIADAMDGGHRDISDVQARRLFRATGSLGGARPKANVRIGDSLWLAKFPRPHGDQWDVMAWEAATLDLMADAGIHCPERSVRRFEIEGDTRTVLLLRRFDRKHGVRIPYISAMTALEARDGGDGDWLDLAEWAAIHGADVTELWRRGVFGALIGNQDDHLRNHGFLRQGSAWMLAPAFDVNPTPWGDGEEHQLALFGDPAPNLDVWLGPEALGLFRVQEAEAHAWLARLPALFATAARRAETRGADARSVEVMASRFDRARAEASR